MKLKELARLLQAHPKSSGATVALGKRLLREAEQADLADTDAGGATVSDPVGMNDPDLNAAAGAGFRAIADAIIAKVFDGSAAWADVRDQLDRVFAAYDTVLDRTPATSGVTESYTDPPLRRRGRLLAESILDREPVKLHLAGDPFGGARDTADDSRAYVPDGKRFLKSILNGD